MGVKKCIILVGDYEQNIMISPAFLSLSSGFIIPLQAPMLFKLPFIAAVFALLVTASALLAAAMKGSLRSIRLEGNETGRKAEKGWGDYNLHESLNGESMTSKKKMSEIADSWYWLDACYLGEVLSQSHTDSIFQIWVPSADSLGLNQPK